MQVVGLWSHMACADEPGHPSIASQLRIFDEAVEFAEKAGVRPEVRHIANSAATLTIPEARYDLVRPGIAVYGLSPIPSHPASDGREDRIFGLLPAMTLTGRLIITKRVGPGSVLTQHDGSSFVSPLSVTSGPPLAVFVQRHDG